MLTHPALETFVREARKTHLKRTKKTGLFVGASEVGLCLRKVWYGKQRRMTLDPKHSDDTESWGAARRGVTFEEHFWVPAMRKKYGANLLYTGRQQKTMTYITKEAGLRATPDGLLINQKRDVLKDLHVPDIGPSRCVVLECKTIDPRIKLDQPKPEHTFQAHMQMGLFRRGKKYMPDYAVIAYTNASFFDDVVEFPIKYDDKIFQAGEKRAAMVKAATRPEDLKPEGWISGGNECNYCMFKVQCFAINTGRNFTPLESEKPPEPAWLKKITSLAKHERELSTTVSINDELRREIQNEIKNLMRAAKVRQATGYGVKIIWSPVKGRPSIDMKGLKEEASKLGLDVQKFETTGDPTDRLLIHVINSVE